MFQERVESLSPLFGVSQGHAHGHAKYAKAQRADAPSRWRHQVVGWGWAFHVVHHMGSGGCNMVVDVAADPAAKIRRAWAGGPLVHSEMVLERLTILPSIGMA